MSKPRVLIGVSSFAEADRTPLDLLQARVDVVPNPHGRRLTEEELVSALAEIDGLIAGLEPLNRRVLEGANRLRAIARVGIGMTNVDCKAASELGIRVSSTPEPPAQAVAEMTCAALLALCRRLLPSNRALHRGEWRKSIGSGLDGRRVLLVGYGRIGRKVAEMLRPFGARVMVTDPALAATPGRDDVETVALADGLRRAEVVSLHASGDATLLGAAELALLPAGAILLNSARAALVDEDALVEALISGRVGAAWFDVFWQEPYAGRLCAFEQVLLTPHMSTYTEECRLRMESEAVRNLLRDLDLA
jgi:D-3-phosphoglycerate dehydrogenase